MALHRRIQLARGRQHKVQELNRLAGCRLEYSVFACGNERTIAFRDGPLVGATRDIERPVQYKDKTDRPVVYSRLLRRQMNAQEFEVARRVRKTR